MAKKTEDAVIAGVFLLFIAAIAFVVGWYIGYTNESGQIVGIVVILSSAGGILSIKNPEKYGHIGIAILDYFKGIGERAANNTTQNKKEMKNKNNKVNGNLNAVQTGNDSTVNVYNERMESKNTVLQIEKETEVVGCKPIRIAGEEPYFDYACTRIFIKNIGRNAAKDCKGYFITDKSRGERVCWTIPKERPNATINVGDCEKLDFCAFPLGTKGNDIILIPTEDGWENIRRTGPIDPISTVKVRVTSENAQPVEANVKIYRDEKRIEIG